MNASSSSLRTGWITIWIVLGVVALTLFVAVPLLITQRAQGEFLRYEACVEKTQTTNCQPSLVWALNGWSVDAASSTGSVPASSTSTSVSTTTEATRPYSALMINN
jgi:hypothetical protein